MGMASLSLVRNCVSAPATGRSSTRRSRSATAPTEPVNSCITLLGQLDGAELITVEDLADEGVLHPVQEAMVGRVAELSAKEETADGYALGARRSRVGIDRSRHCRGAAPVRFSAGAAIAFRAAFLGADRPLLQAQPVEQSGARRKFADPHAAAAPLKS